ncbi:MAG: hypothetical protein AB1716_15425 [Planctomycetota bacterium]
MMSVQPPPVAVKPRRNLILRLFTSIWLGVTLLALILAYSSAMSAYAPLRWAMEMTEMQAFRHWFFVLLIVLFLLAITAVTLFRTRWRLVNLGSHLSHAGLILMSVGCIAYFGTKIEGDVRLDAPAILIRARMGEQPMLVGRFRAAPGETWARVLPDTRQALALTVRDLTADGVQPAAKARLEVRVGDAAPRYLDLAAGGDDWQKITEILDVQLRGASARAVFYDDDRPTLYVRSPEGGEFAKAIPHLPLHRERYLPEGGPVRDAQNREVPSRRTTLQVRVLGIPIPTGWFEPWRMPIELDSEGLPFRVTITGYIPAVRGLRAEQAADGSIRREPVLELAENRRPDVGRSMSAIRIRFTGVGPAAGWTETQWCLYSNYPDGDEVVQRLHVLPPGAAGPWELIYSRARHELGATVAARKAYVEYQPGQQNIDTFHSDLLIQEPGGAVRPVNVSTNETLQVGHWTLYQSNFDFQEHWAYTVLGVGNRTGLWAMNIGWMVVTAGCLFAFYVKPILLRRRVPAGAGRAGTTAQRTPALVPSGGGQS